MPNQTVNGELLERVRELESQGLGYHRIAAELGMKLGTAARYLAVARGKEWIHRNAATGWKKKMVFVVFCADPRRSVDRRVCHKSNRRAADNRAARLNGEALAAQPGAHPWEVPLYYVAREAVDVQTDDDTLAEDV